MGLLDHAQQVAERASASNAASAAAISAATFPFNRLVSAAGFLLTLVYLWCAMPRFCRTVVALKRRIFNHDRTLWDSLSKQPVTQKED